MISFLKNLQHWHKKCDNFPLAPTQCPNYNGPGYKPPCSHTVFSGFCQSEDSCTAEGGKKGLTVSISKNNFISIYLFLFKGSCKVGICCYNESSAGSGSSATTVSY